MPIASISGVTYEGDMGEGDMGFLGFYIVVPEFRGRGYGIRLWQACMDYLAGRNVGLDGVVAQQDNYRKSGFRLAYNNIRYRGDAIAARSTDEAKNSGVIDAARVPFETVAAYDRACFFAPRAAFLRAWLDMPGAHALALPSGAGIAGFGVVRPCREGHKIGPLFADDAESAETLFRALAAKAGPGPVFLDIPAVNPAAAALVASRGMTPVFETARMYTGPDPDIDLGRVFGITTFELG